MATKFHSRVGSMVTLSNGGITAQRNHPAQEFNNGVVFSAEKLADNQLFQVKIDRKVNSWSGSIEVGITTCDPANLVFPTSATGFREGTWVMSGCSIMRDGHTILDEYGQDLDQLAEGDRIGVMRSAAGMLHIFINGIDQGPAASAIPLHVWAVIDMYGKCAQVTVYEDTNLETASASISRAAVENTSLSLLSALCNNLVAEALTAVTSDLSSRLMFHDRCGTLVKLSNSGRTAERQRALDEFNNGVVMTARPLRDNERFEIRIDHLVDKWSGSIEVGITTHNPNTLDFPATMTNMRSGTIMMSGSGILTNGKGTRREYGDFNLDELQRGDRIGLVRKSSGALHYFINDVDQGVATTRAPQVVWGVVDLYGMAVKVTIVEVPTGVSLPSGDETRVLEAIPVESRVVVGTTSHLQAALDECREHNERLVACDRLQFHPHCGSHAAVINGHRSAHRPRAIDDFNNAVVLTNRQLQPGELFEVQLDQLVDKWAGSIEIGVTTHSPLELEFPSTMTNVRTGTWMMTGNGVMHNGATVLEDYGQNLDQLRVGDRIGVKRFEDGSLHFYVNGIDQGLATRNVPSNIYGVVDLYGQAGQATIVTSQEVEGVSSSHVETNVPTVGVAPSDAAELRFHQRHGRNAILSANYRSASRSSNGGEFNEAVVASSRPLRDDELFEIRVDKMVERWSGSLEVGVTLGRPEDLVFPNTLTELVQDTWALSGSSVMRDGSTITSRYQLDLSKLQTGSRVGVVRCSDQTLHYYLDGVDQGIACSNIPTGVYAIIDLYGQCVEVSISDARYLSSAANASRTSTQTVLPPDIELSPMSPGVSHRFSVSTKHSVVLKNTGSTACRVKGFEHALVHSSEPLQADELFEIKIDSLSVKWSGSLLIGLTTASATESSACAVLPAAGTDLHGKMTWMVRRSEVVRNGVTVLENYCPCLDRLVVGDRIGVLRSADGNMHILVNDCDFGVAASNIPRNIFAVIDLYGQVEAVSTTSARFLAGTQHTTCSISSANLEAVQEPRCVCPSETRVPVSSLNEEAANSDEDLSSGDEFSSFLHGENLSVSSDGKSVKRISSYNCGLVVSRKPLRQGRIFQVCVTHINPQWSSSLALGVTSLPRDVIKDLPNSALDIRWPSWFVQANSVFNNTTKIQRLSAQLNLDDIEVGQTVGVSLDSESSLHLYFDGVDVGVVARGIADVEHCHAFVDVYGQCEEVSFVTSDHEDARLPGLQEQREKADKEHGQKEKHHSMKVTSKQGGEVLPENCTRQNACLRLIKSYLCLPDGYFNRDASCCYCEVCHKARGDSLYFRHGEPPRDYALPVGWCKFALRLPPKSEAQHVTVLDKWHVAYHGTTVGDVRKILDTGDLLALSGNSLVGGVISRSLYDRFGEKNKPEENVVLDPVVLSPSIKFAGSPGFAVPFEYGDTKDSGVHSARVALEIFVKPGSYMVGSVEDMDETLEQIDAKISNNELEWTTKERGSTALSGLLVRID